MLIYLRRIRIEKEKEVIKWYDHWRGSLSVLTESEQKKYLETVLKKENLLRENTALYTVEKGDEEYGLFSYAIAGVCLVNIDADASSCELVMLPSSDEEWNEQAKAVTLKLLLDEAFSQWNMHTIYIRVDNDENKKISWLKSMGFTLESGDETDLAETELSGMIRLKAVRKQKLMKILVTGVAGKLGYDLVRELYSRGHEVIGSDILENCDLKALDEKNNIPYIPMDIVNEAEVKKTIASLSPDAVIHCAAWTAVDDAEREENKKKVYDINVNGTENIAAACKACNSSLMYITTDYVFNGEGTEPWKADCREFEPLNYYGRTKLEGEQKIEKILSAYFIIRTEWAFGENGKNFVDIMLDIAKRRKRLTVVDDQIGTPTYCHDLSILLADIIETQKYGHYNVTNSGGFVSRYEFAKEIFRQAAELGHSEYSDENLLVHPSATEEYGPSITVRPLNSRLDLSKLKENGFTPLPSWKDALLRYLKQKDFTV